METIKELLNKRTIADSTKKVYIKKLEMLHKGLAVDGWGDDFGFIKDTDRTMEWINQFNSAKKRTLFNACMVASEIKGTSPYRIKIFWFGAIKCEACLTACPVPSCSS